MKRTHDTHHVFPKQCRETTETKIVPLQDHRDWHTLMWDMHPRFAIGRLAEILYGDEWLNDTQREALARLMIGRTRDELHDYLIENFLPEEDYYQDAKWG